MSVCGFIQCYAASGLLDLQPCGCSRTHREGTGHLSGDEAGPLVWLHREKGGCGFTEWWAHHL